MNRIKRLLFRFKIMNIKINYELNCFELMNEGIPAKSLLPWKTYLLIYLRKYANK